MFYSDNYHLKRYQEAKTLNPSRVLRILDSPTGPWPVEILVEVFRLTFCISLGVQYVLIHFKVTAALKQIYNCLKFLKRQDGQKGLRTLLYLFLTSSEYMK